MRWLLDGDPAIRWQVMRDLTHESEGVIATERARISVEGWGCELLGLQAPDGVWFGPDEGWMTTIQALGLLADMGLDPESESAHEALSRVKKNLTWSRLHERPFFEGETEPCINGAILAAGSYFGERCDAILERLLREQLADGGWNCEAPPSSRASFHTTIRVLEGLLEYEKAFGATGATARARRRGEEYLLVRRMLRSLRTGEVLDRKWTRFSFPMRWHYDVLRGLDYLRSAGREPDERVAEAVAIVKARSHQNGRWPMNHLHADRIPFDMEVEVGRASRWNTLRALRVLDWASS
jgi:hypothetical protein